MSDFVSLDIQTFADCASQMKLDEIMCNDLFNANKAMKSITLGSQRTDSHVIANGIHSIEDYISKGNYLPDENITHDEIRQIQGKLLDCMMARFNGNNLFQTVLTCVYVHKNYTIKNPLLRTVIYSYLHLIYTVEDFINKYKVGSNSTWANDLGVGVSYLPDKATIDPASLRADLEKCKSDDQSISDISNFSIFMLDFSDYLLDFQHKECPKIPEIPKESATFGFSDVLHNRQLSTSIPPILMQIKSHEKSIQQFTDMVNLISGFKNIPKPTSLLGLVQFTYDWTTSNPKAIILARVVLCAILLPSEESMSIYGWPSFKDLLISDFKNIRVTDSIFKADKVVTVESTVYTFFSFAIHSMLMPLCIAHSSLEGKIINYWNLVCNFLIGALIKTHKYMSFPKIDSESMSRSVENPMYDYSNRISLEILLIYIKLGFKCSIYNVLDYGQLFLYFSIIHKSLKEIYYNDRVVAKIYDAYNFQGKSKNGRKKPVSSANVLNRIGEESNEELSEVILAEYFEYCVYYMQFILKTNSIKLQKNEFYNQKTVFESRRAPLTKIQTVQFVEFSNYEFLYGSKYTVQQIQAQIKRKAEDVKANVKKLNSRPNPPEWIKDILKRVVTSSLMLMQWKEGDTFEISLDVDYMPSFLLKKKA